MSDYGTEVKLLALTSLSAGLEDELQDVMRGWGVALAEQHGEALVEYAGRLCWDTQDKTGSTPDRIQKWIEVGHESVIEHASMTFYIRASRVLTHELVRHRIASYSQRSQRYVDESEPRYITPPEVHGKFFGGGDGIPTGQVFKTVMERCWDSYRMLLEAGVPREVARYVLPNACETQIIMTMNFRELRYFIKLRTSKRALPEMREVAGKVKDICKKVAPQVFEDL